MLHNFKIASSFLFLTMAIKVLELDKKHILIGEFKIKAPYISFINTLISTAIKERKKLRETMKREDIKVNFLYREGNFTYYEFIINQSKTVKCYFNPIIKKEVEKIISKLMLKVHKNKQSL